MKIKRLIVTAAFIFAVSTSSLSINDCISHQFTKIVMEDNEQNTKPNISIIAHRGFSSLEIENSYNAVKLGFDSNCTTSVEIDVQLTKDNEIILFHDSKINDKEISKYTLEELQEIPITEKILDNFDTYMETFFDSKSGNIARERMHILEKKSEHITTLDEILLLHSNYPNKTLIIELKNNDDNNDILIDNIYNKIKNLNIQNIIIQSSNYDTLIKMKDKYPNLEYHLIVNKNNYNYMKNNDFDGYGIKKSLINYDDINSLLKNNKKVSIWTINTYSEYEEATNRLNDLKNKVSYITNYPDALRTWHNLNNKNKVKIKK